MIEGCQLGGNNNPFNRRGAIAQKDRQKRNMNRKHLIHQRIKCQGIPIVNASDPPMDPDGHYANLKYTIENTIPST
jgi:hypothetical protein